MKFRNIYLSLFIFIFFVSPSQAFWVWTPETNKWVNPKYAVKDTPAEQLTFALEFLKAKEYEEAIREFNKLLRHYPRAREAPDAQFYIGLAWEEQGNPYQSFKQYQEVIEKYPFSERSPEIVQKQYDIGVKMIEGPEKGKFLEFFTGTDLNVVEVFETVIKNAPYGTLAPQARYKIGLFLLEKLLYQEARDEFEKVVNDYPESEWAKAAKYQIAVTDSERSTSAQYDQKVTKSAVEEFKEFVEVYPDAELSAKAKAQIHELREKEAENNFVVAQFYEKQKNYASAKIYYQDIVDDYGTTSWASKALERIQILSRKIK